MPPTSPHGTKRAGQIMRWMAVPAGMVVAAFVLVIGGFVVVAASCEGDLGRSTSAICTRGGALVGVFELCLLALAVIAPLAGAVATVAEREARWLGYGVLAAAAIFVLLLGLAGEQASLLAG